MEHDMIVYESEEAMARNPADTERFEKSYAALKAVGVEIDRVMCSSADDIGEAAKDATDNVKKALR